MIKKMLFSFAVSCCCGLIVYILSEWIACVLIGIENFSAMTPEYRAKFPSDTLAMGVAVLSHGLIGAAFSGATVIYEKIEIGFILQNILYFLATGAVWILVICYVWQLYRYPEAFFFTTGGFLITYIIMSIFGYGITKREVAQINAKLAEEE